jgi:hypothetical protein
MTRPRQPIPPFDAMLAAIRDAWACPAPCATPDPQTCECPRMARDLTRPTQEPHDAAE